MLSEAIKEEAASLHAQIVKGVVVIPAITSFLSKIKRQTKGERKSKKQIEEDQIAEMSARMHSRKNSRRSNIH